ncbi:DUF1592 domain-containing protein [Symmachiella dynata]|uniref:DUF1592 domain-containing protein n=1 Tax=Symmachiella dynata TaxID=2527995 RepID=UPI0018D39E94|nr:DUF1592 domain-containing protein [Symmachiella dynata]
MRSIFCLLLLTVCFAVAPTFSGADEKAGPTVESSAAEQRERVKRDLRALYTFSAGKGDVVHDQSGVRPQLDLRIAKLPAVKWKSDGLLIRSVTKIRSIAPAKKLIATIKRTGEVTVEAWIVPANDRQSGPARIVSLSANPSGRNVTLGQDGDRYDVRLRTTATSGNGQPSTSTDKGVVKTKLTHVVYTRDIAGNARIYLNGKENVDKKIDGQFSNWSNDDHLTLANESTGGRPWLGTLQLAALYSRALSANEVEQNFQAGPVVADAAPQTAENHQAQVFANQVAPLLAKQCLDCHDSFAKKGGLDLSRQASAVAGGENGKAIVPGNSADSLLWDQIESDAMPPEGEPLTAEQKKLLRQWIDDGAHWSVDLIDPAVYANNSPSGAVWLQRLTVSEYIATVREAVGVDISQEAREILPPDLRADGFSNTAYNLSVDFKHVEAYARLAEIIVSRMDVLKFARKFSKSKKLSTDSTMRKFVAKMGKRLLRGPLDEREITNFSGIATTVASTGGDYEEAVRYLIEAMLQSPRFMYRVENQQGDGTAWPVGGYELASRLSYILWGGPPDKELFRAAEAGELGDQAAIEKQVQRMLDDPRAINRSLQFVTEWLDLGRLENLRPNRERFPNWNDALAADMRDETLAFFKEVAWTQKRPLADLFNAQVTFATPQLAEYYGIEPQGPGLERYDLTSVAPRGGLLTQGSVLTMGGDDASMVTRGLFVLKDVLRGMVKSPPPGLDTTPVPSSPGLSQRHIGEQRIANTACGGCHSKFEPLAFGLEKYDGLGAFHDKDEHGNELRSDGEVLFPGTAQPVKYQTSAELMDLLANSERVRETLTWKLTQFALGRPLGAADAPIVGEIDQAAQQNGGTYSALITAIVMSDLVQTTRTEATPVEKKP